MLIFSTLFTTGRGIPASGVCSGVALRVIFTCKKRDLQVKAKLTKMTELIV